MHRAKAIEKKGGGLEWGGGSTRETRNGDPEKSKKKNRGKGQGLKKKKKFDLPPRGAGIFFTGPPVRPGANAR